MYVEADCSHWSTQASACVPLVERLGGVDHLVLLDLSRSAICTYEEKPWPDRESDAVGREWRGSIWWQIRQWGQLHAFCAGDSRDGELPRLHTASTEAWLLQCFLLDIVEYLAGVVIGAELDDVLGGPRTLEGFALCRHEALADAGFEARVLKGLDGVRRRGGLWQVDPLNCEVDRIVPVERALALEAGISEAGNRRLLRLSGAVLSSSPQAVRPIAVTVRATASHPILRFSMRRFRRSFMSEASSRVSARALVIRRQRADRRVGGPYPKASDLATR